MIVIDASAAMSWLLQSQNTVAATNFLVDTAAESYEAPFVFEWEVKNILLGLMRGGALSAVQYRKALDRLDGLNIRLGAPFMVARVETLAMMEGLSLFDAAYLDHALVRGAELASRDRALVRAARRSGLTVHDFGSA